MLKFIIVVIWMTVVSIVTFLISLIEFVVKLLYKVFINWAYRFDKPFTEWAGGWFLENRKVAMGWLQP